MQLLNKGTCCNNYWTLSSCQRVYKICLDSNPGTILVQKSNVVNVNFLVMFLKYFLTEINMGNIRLFARKHCTNLLAPIHHRSILPILG